MFRHKITLMLKYLFCYPCVIISERFFCFHYCCFCCWLQRWCKPNAFNNTVPSVSTVCDQIYSSNKNKCNNGQTIQMENGWNFDNEIHQNPISLASWSSTTNSGNTTGQQQAISELISMSAFLEQQNSLNNQNIINSFVTKEQRLALMTTQAGRRRYHSGQLIMLFTRANQQQQQQQEQSKNQSKHQSQHESNEITDSEPITKTTSLNLISYCSSSESEMNNNNNSPKCDNV